MTTKSAAGTVTADAIASAARAIFEDEGTAGISMRRVADAVGITPMAIYRHYPNREALLDRVANLGFQELLGYWKAGDAPLPPDERVLELLDGYVDYALAHPRVFDYVFSEARPGARRFPEDFHAGLSPTANLLHAAVQQGMADGLFRRDDIWNTALALWALSHGLICLYRGGRFSFPPAAFRTFHRKLLRKMIDGIRE